MKCDTSARPARSNIGPGIPLVGVLSVQFDYGAIRKKFNRQKPDWNLFSAVEEKFFPPIPVGNTPFFKSAALGNELGFAERLAQERRAESQRVAQRPRVVPCRGRGQSAEGENHRHRLHRQCRQRAGRRLCRCRQAAIIFVPENAPKAQARADDALRRPVIPVQGHV